MTIATEEIGGDLQMELDELESLETVTEEFDPTAETKLLERKKSRKLSNAQIVKNLFNGHYKSEEHKTTNLYGSITKEDAAKSKAHTLNGKHYSTVDEVMHAATYLLRNETDLDEKRLADDMINLYETIGIIGKHKEFHNQRIDRQTKNYETSHKSDEILIYTKSQTRKRDKLFAKYDSVIDQIEENMSFIKAKINRNKNYEISDHLEVAEAELIEDPNKTEVGVQYGEPRIKSRNGPALSLTNLDGRVGVLTSEGTIAPVPNQRVVEQAILPAAQHNGNNNGNMYHHATKPKSLRQRAGSWLKRFGGYFSN